VIPVLYLIAVVMTGAAASVVAAWAGLWSYPRPAKKEEPKSK